MPSSKVDHVHAKNVHPNIAVSHGLKFPVVLADIGSSEWKSATLIQKVGCRFMLKL